MAISICNVHTNSNQKEITSYVRGDFPIACYEDNMQEITVPVHWHDEFEYIIATKGIVTVCTNGDHIDLNEGDSIFINSGCLHGVKSVTNSDSVLRSLIILPRFIGGSADNVIFNKLILPFSKEDSPSYILLNEHCNWQYDIRKYMLNSWIAITDESYDFENESRFFISRAIRLIVDHLSEAKVIYKTKDNILERIRFTINYIEEHYNTDISIQDLTALLDCSESVLLRNFKKIAGTSPMQFLLNYRIQKAAEMLLTTDMKSNAIAFSCGFHDFSYFIKIFKRNMGVTPAKYRESKIL